MAMTQMVRALVVLALAATSAACFMSHDISAAEAKKLVSDGARLVDVRTPEEYAAKHLPGAVNIPVADLETRLGELAPKEQPIVVYCRSGHRASRAQKILQGVGFTRVYNLGGMARWESSIRR